MSTKSPRELAARALCRKAGHPEDTKFEGKPMWMSFLDEVDTVLSAIRETPPAAWAVRDIDGEDYHSVHIFEEQAKRAEFGLGSAVALYDLRIDS